MVMARVMIAKPNLVSPLAACQSYYWLQTLVLVTLQAPQGIPTVGTYMGPKQSMETSPTHNLELGRAVALGVVQHHQRVDGAASLKRIAKVE